MAAGPDGGAARGQRGAVAEAVIELASGRARALIDPVRGFRCSRLVVDGWSVLGSEGIRIEFPWVGAGAARAARLGVGGAAVDIGGGGLAITLAPGAWTVDDPTVDARGETRARL